MKVICTFVLASIQSEYRMLNETWAVGARISYTFTIRFNRGKREELIGKHNVSQAHYYCHFIDNNSYTKQK